MILQALLCPYEVPPCIHCTHIILNILHYQQVRMLSALSDAPVRLPYSTLYLPYRLTPAWQSCTIEYSCKVRGCSGTVLAHQPQCRSLLCVNESVLLGLGELERGLGRQVQRAVHTWASHTCDRVQGEGDDQSTFTQ